ncbi:hypothetical protein Pmani_034016, partial [Petrolisthes manimaculis]
YDATESSFTMGHRWKNNKVLGSRAYFISTSSPPVLTLQPVHAYDQGMFTCRVDYRSSPSTTVFVNLTVVVPPGPPLVLWEGVGVVGSVGPLGEGQRTKLTCRSSGGRPAPTLSWYANEKVLPIAHAKKELDTISETYTSEASISVVVTRDLLGVEFRCHASAPHQPPDSRDDGTSLPTTPRVASVFVNVTLPPVEVRILASARSVRAGTTLRLVCQSSGSHPPAVLTWQRGHAHLPQVTHSIENGGNITTATLTILVNRHHDGALLSCTGTNPALPHAALTDTITLSVTYAPVVGLDLGKTMIEDRIKEGGRHWHHNNVELQHNMSAGVMMNGKDLAIRGLRRADSGSYTCTAANIEGRTTSNAVRLAVRLLLGLALTGAGVEGKRIHRRSLLNTGATSLPSAYNTQHPSSAMDGPSALPGLRTDLLTGSTKMMEALNTEDDVNRQQEQGDQKKGETYTITITDSATGKPEVQKIDVERTPSNQDAQQVIPINVNDDEALAEQIEAQEASASQDIPQEDLEGEEREELSEKEDKKTPAIDMKVSTKSKYKNRNKTKTPKHSASLKVSQKCPLKRTTKPVCRQKLRKPVPCKAPPKPICPCKSPKPVRLRIPPKPKCPCVPQKPTCPLLKARRAQKEE